MKLPLSIIPLLLACSPCVAQQAYIKASNTAAGDLFGVVALAGDTAVVGAPGQGVNQSGAAYVFTRTGGVWSQQALLKASNADTGDKFGSAVAISGDTLVVGAFWESSNASGVNGDQTNNSLPASGAAYVFVRSGAVWTQQAYLKASAPGASNGFGEHVSIDGDTIVVGAQSQGSGSGAAYVFTRAGSVWSQQALLKASNQEERDFFGSAVSISGNTIVVGATQESSSASGVNGNQSDNGRYASGAAYVFTRSGSAWTQQAYLKASNPGVYDLFGSSVAIDGDTLAVGATSEDSSSTGVNSTPNTSASFSGAAYVFTRTAGVWTQQAYLKASNTEADDRFGTALAVSGDRIVVVADGEDSAAVGVGGDQSSNLAGGSGAAYVFSRTGSTWTQQAYLKASNTGAADGLLSVALSGTTILCGAICEDSAATGIGGSQADNSASCAGAAYVYDDLSISQYAEANLSRGGYPMDSGASYDFGKVRVGQTPSDHFILRNQGNLPLLITGPPVISGPDAGMVQVQEVRQGSVVDFSTSVPPGKVADYLVRLTPASPGLITARVSFLSNDPDESTYELNLSVTGLTTLEAWRQDWFHQTDSTGIAADLADPDKDGVPNLLEYAFGRQPNDPATRDNPLPQPIITASQMVLSFNHPAYFDLTGYAPGILYGAEVSSSMQPGSWTPLPDTGTGSTHTFTLPISPATSSRMFLRLKVTTVP